MNLAGKTILVTGGTGSFGKAFINYLLESEVKVSGIIVFSRDEQKQYEMAQDLSEYAHLIRYCLGDVRDRERITETARSADIIVHSAAMKHVPAAEHNPIECIKTNIIGSQNLIYAAQANKVLKVVILSTDKAVLPSNLLNPTTFQPGVVQSKTTPNSFLVKRSATLLGRSWILKPWQK